MRLRPLPAPLALACAGTAAAFGLLLAVRYGAVALTRAEFLAALSGSGSGPDRFIITGLRAPRALMASLVGGGLAVAGATLQALLRNPLAEPYILGISGGAALGAVLALAGGWVSVASFALPLAAFAGALLAIGLVFGVAFSGTRRMDVGVLLLAGVVVGAFFQACVALVLTLAEANTIRSALLWMMGSIDGASWGGVTVVAAYTIPLLAVLVSLARPLNAMAIGEETATYLGTDVERIKRLAYGSASLVAAAGVTFAGVIGFVGLIVPHGVRLVAGGDHRLLLPLSFLAGAAFLTVADLVARTALAPAEIPVGIVTALVGVPFFLLLLKKGPGR